MRCTRVYKSSEGSERPCGDRGQNGEQIVHRQWDPSDTRQRIGSLFPSLYDQQVEVLNVTSSIVVDEGGCNQTLHPHLERRTTDDLHQRIRSLLPYPLMLNEGALGIQKWTTP